MRSATVAKECERNNFILVLMGLISAVERECQILYVLEGNILILIGREQSLRGLVVL